MEIPKTYNPKEAEEKWYRYWEDKKLFSPESNTNPDAPVFTMVIPPPNVTGYLHMGHALNHTLQDVLARWGRMRGDKVLWLPGTDHAGIATQMIVEKQLAQEGLNRRDMGREKFLERVWSWKEHSGGAIQNQMRILGDSVDWSRERFTMDEGLSNAVKEVFVRLFDEGLIYRGEYMINWSPGLQTAISDLEVEMKPVNGRLYHIAYPLDHNVDSAMLGLSELYEEQKHAEGAEGGGGKSGILRTPHGDFLVVATTRPETMLGDTAVALNPEDTRYKGITSRKAILPLVGRELSLIEDAIVEKDFGTGFVKVTPAHDPNDFAMGRRHNLEFIQIIGKDAKITDNAPEKYRGLDRVEARKVIVADLDNLGLLLKVENYNHNIGHCQRSGTIVEPLITMQWFLKMESLAKPALEAVKDGRTKFIPESMTVIYNNWLENIRDWCISRQLWWGHRIPAWYTNDGTMIVARDEDEARQRLADMGGDTNATLTQDSDVLDTWFSSALWPFSTLGWPDNTDDLKKYYPTTTLVTAADIIFFWVARMMMMGLKFMGEVPFSTVYINALVLDPEGKKMSKTKGNVVDPLVIFDKYGTDAARFTLTAASTAGLSLTLQETKLESARNFANKIWNATRFVLMNCDDVLRHEDQVSPVISDLGENPELADQWIFYRLNKTANEVDAALSEYKFHEAADLLYKYFWNDFCDWYIELSKPFVTSKDLSSRTIAVKRRIIFILERSLRLLHPIMPYITEELWQRLPHEGDSISVSNYIDNTNVKVDDNAEREMNFVIEIITKLRNIRSTFNIAPSVSLRVQIAPMSDDARKIIIREEEHIKRLARIEILEIQDTIANEHGSARAVISGATIAIPLEGLIDFEKEKARLDKELTKLASEREGLEKRLSSADFINRATPDVVELTRNRSSEITDQIEKLKVMRSAL